jgi:hypothetical protein
MQPNSTINPYGGMRPGWAFPRSSGPVVKAYRTEAEKDAARVDNAVSYAEFVPRCSAYHRNRVALHRARCIGEGLVRVRARMERFVAWLREQDACEEGIAFARQHVSPEAAVHAAAAGAPEERTHACWLWMVVPRYGGSCPGCDRDASELLASKEWASLPWQRDPEVSR